MPAEEPSDALTAETVRVSSAALLDALADLVAARVLARMERRLAASPPAWMTKEEAIEYTRIPRGTFEMLAARGTLPSHGGKTKVFSREELDRALSAL
jgi:excisionase family DNA binding protein